MIDNNTYMHKKKTSFTRRFINIVQKIFNVHRRKKSETTLMNIVRRTFNTSTTFKHVVEYEYIALDPYG